MPAFPYLPVVGAAAALRFYEVAFGAEIFHEIEGDDGRIIHARFRIEDAVIMLYEYTDGELPGIVAPGDAGLTTVTVRVLVAARETVDRIFAAAADHGAKILAEPAEVPWNEYYGRLIDPFGHAWAFGASLE